MSTNIILIGHVNSGKTTISEHIINEVLNISEKKERYTLSTKEEESKKGFNNTYNLNYRALQIKCKDSVRDFILIDSPGHNFCIKHTHIGLLQSDIAILVIDGTDIDFDIKSDTLEFLILIRTSRIKNLIVIINKMDHVSINWDKGRYELIKNKLNDYLSEDYYPFDLCLLKSNKKEISTWKDKIDKVIIIPSSGKTGENISFLSKKCEWYKGMTLFDSLCNSNNENTIKKNSNDPKGDYFIISEVNYPQIFGQVKLGTINKGLYFLLSTSINPRSINIKNIYSMENEITRKSLVTSNENDIIELDVNIKDNNIDSIILPGDIIIRENNFFKKTKKIISKVKLLKSAIIVIGSNNIINIYGRDVSSTITGIYTKINKDSSIGKNTYTNNIKADSTNSDNILLELILDNHSWVIERETVFILRNINNKLLLYGLIMKVKD